MNINTPDFWDEQFSKEWELMKEGGLLSGADGYRWDPTRFSVVGGLIKMRGKLLDIGCGLGNFCRYMKARNPFLEVHGCDFSKMALNYAGKVDDRIAYELGESNKLPYPNGSFDFVSAQEIIEHLDNPAGSLNEWKRVLKKGGELIITTPVGGGHNKISNEHVKEYSPTELNDLLKVFFEKIRYIFPRAEIDVITKEVVSPFWFVAICEK